MERRSHPGTPSDGSRKPPRPRRPIVLRIAQLAYDYVENPWSGLLLGAILVFVAPFTVLAAGFGYEVVLHMPTMAWSALACACVFLFAVAWSVHALGDAGAEYYVGKGVSPRDLVLRRYRWPWNLVAGVCALCLIVPALWWGHTPWSPLAPCGDGKGTCLVQGTLDEAGQLQETETRWLGSGDLYVRHPPPDAAFVGDDPDEYYTRYGPFFRSGATVLFIVGMLAALWMRRKAGGQLLEADS